MNTFECYQMFMALKMHFTGSYDYIKYNGKLKSATPVKLESHKQKFYFQKLQKMNDPKGYIIANLLRNEDAWIGDLFSSEGEKCYAEWRKRRESLTYTVQEECKNALIEPFNDNFTVIDNSHPYLFQQYLRHNISIESIIVLDGAISYLPYWNRKMKDDVMWDVTSRRIAKYKPFMPEINTNKIKSFLREQYG